MNTTFPGNHRVKTNELLSALSAEIDYLYDSQDSDRDPYFYEREPIHLINIALMILSEKVTGKRERVHPPVEVAYGVLVHSRASSLDPSG